MIPLGVRKICPFSLTSRPALGPTQSPIQQVRRLLPGGKQNRSDVDHLRPSSAEVKNEWSPTSIPPYAFKDCIEKNLYFYLHICLQI
jgi:hypothetical protein